MIDIKKDLISIACDLIKIESETDNEKNLCNILFETLNICDGKLIRFENSLVLTINGGKEKHIALVGHLDTVPVDKSSLDPEIKDGELWGRGACDMKSGLACMLKIIDDIQREKIIPEYKISFVFYEKEEGPIPNGINNLLDNNLLDTVDFAYVLEPTGGLYSVGCLGSIAVKKEVSGISAHSANPLTGKNALDELFLIYDKVRNMNKEIGKTQSINGLKFYETVNVTAVNTYNAFNVIPSKADMIINFRFSPLRTVNEAREFLIDFIGREGVSILDESGSCYIGDIKSIYLKNGIECEIMQAWTDIVQLNEAGISAVNFGAGSIRFAHKPDERISIPELKTFYKKLITYL